MKWVKRGCWLPAWGVWVYCGFGLARELPRPDGPTLAKLDLEDGEWIDRLVVGTNLAVSRSVAPDGERSRRVWDLRMGEISTDRLDAKEDEVDRGFLDQRGPLNERGDRVEDLTRLLERMRSTDGKVELDAAENIVKDVASGRIIDSGGAEQPFLNALQFRLSVTRSFGAVPGASIYVCEEFWSGSLGSAPFLKETYAIHALADGRLLYRLQHPLIWATSDGVLSLRANGDITVLPPDPNYPLLALCQTILALPLVLFWCILRWRRKRKARPT